MKTNSDARLIDAFEDAFDIGKPIEIDLAPDGVLVVALAYNEVLRLPYFLEHYRGLGADHFIIVDNASDDGTAELLEAQPDVTRLLSSRPFSDYISTWRRLIGDIYLRGRWGLFPDIDELFVHPGWPDRPLRACLRHWEESGAEAVMAPMVDMYPAGPLKELDYRTGESFLAACPFFDGTGYRLMSDRGARARGETPAIRLVGGARERLFYPPRRSARWSDRLIARHVFSPEGAVRRGRLRRRVDRWAAGRIAGSVSDAPPLAMKVPLVRWREGMSFVRSPHRLAGPARLARDWATLLHFKYLDDFSSKVRTAIARGQHYRGAAEYRQYEGEAEALMARGAAHSGSWHFDGVADLERAGLMRTSPALRAALAE